MRTTEKCEQMKKRRRRCSASTFEEDGAKRKNAELIFGDDFRKKAESIIENEEDPGQQEPGWLMVRKRGRTNTEQGQDTDEASLKDSDSSVYLIRCVSLCQGVGRRKDRERI